MNEIQLYKQKLIDKLQSYGGIGFTQFTSVSNLDSIIKYGRLFSRFYCDKLGINFKNGADLDVLQNSLGRDPSLDLFVRLHFRPKTPDYFMSPLSKTYEDVCYLVIDYNIIFEKEGKIYNRSAACSDYKKRSYKLNSIDDLVLLDRDVYIDFDTIFCMYYKDFIDDRQKQNAEILFHGQVELKYIKAIVFKYSRNRDEFINKYKDLNIETIVDQSWF